MKLFGQIQVGVTERFARFPRVCSAALGLSAQEYEPRGKAAVQIASVHEEFNRRRNWLQTTVWHPAYTDRGVLVKPVMKVRFGSVLAQPYRTLSLSVFAVAVYLCLVNLDHASLWYDEAPTAIIANNLLERGNISGWDGRNLVGGTNGRTLNEELSDVLPPLMYLLNTAGVSAFGFTEVGARIVPALIGILSLGMLFLLAQQQIAGHPRLVFFIFLFVAWSPQLLLYFRQSRYYAFMAFALIAGFYIYERYWQSKNAGWLAGLTLIAALSFCNHYVGGAATILSLAAWHLIFHGRETTLREWLRFGFCGAVVVATGTLYLLHIGVIGGARGGFLEFTGISLLTEYQGSVPLLLLKVWIYMRELFTADWVSWPVFLWFAGMVLLTWRQRNNEAKRVRVSRQNRLGTRRKKLGDSRRAIRERADALPVFASGRIVLMGAMFALFSAALSVQPVWEFPYADLRYYMGALPLLLAMKGLFAEWVWRKSRIAGAVIIFALLFTSVGAAPFNVVMALTGERTLGAHFFRFVREIHHPYRDSVQVVSDYLLENAKKDDLVYVPSFYSREALIFRVGHHVRFCCVLNKDSHLPHAVVEALNAPLYADEHVPDWVVVFDERNLKRIANLGSHYGLVEKLDVHWYQTQRPEINMHAFEPLPARHGVSILRRRNKLRD